MQNKIITDEPSLEDALDFNRYSEELAKIIIHSTPRFTIGIFGGWGMGKTSLMKMIAKRLKDDGNHDILVVWFDAWKYENEKYLTIIPFLRTISIALENYHNSNAGGWEKVKNGLTHTFDAFINSTNITLGLGNYGSAGINLSKFKTVLESKGSVVINGEHIHFHAHVTDYLADSLSKLRDSKQGGNPDCRIVIFIDDLDRCSPDNALEVLESIKTFFDMEGIIFIIGMDSESITSILAKKYGSDFLKGIDYMQKIVQLPFQIPTWLEPDISKSIKNIITSGLKDTTLVAEFDNDETLNLIVNAVQLNPREVKRFINNIILTKMVFNKPINELIAVQALNFRREWKSFLELITPDERRDTFFSEYARLKNDKKSITSQRELDAYSNEITDSDESSRYTRTVFAEIYQNLLKENTNSLNRFLDAGAYKILKNIKKMEEYRRALETTKLKPFYEQDGETGLITIDPSKLLDSSSVTVYKYEEFNSISLLLDTIWWQLLRDKKIKPNTYDKKWCLKDLESGKVFNDIGRDSNYASRSGKRYDYRTLGEIGIRPSMHLLLIPPPSS